MSPTVIFRHQRENLKKCSLRGLEIRKDFQFFSYPCKQIPPLDNYIVLTLGETILSQEDSSYGLCLIDGTWNLAAKMMKNIPLGNCIKRSLPPHYRSAYPRVQTGCQDPQAGLASIEALFIAFHLLGKDTEGLLDHYYWKEPFLAKNGFIC